MDADRDGEQWQVSNIIGWFLAAAAFYPLTLVYLAIRGFGPTSALGVNLLMLTLPLALMLLIGGVGLIMGKQFGYWCAYLAAFFGGIGGLKVPFVPFADRLINAGPATGRVFLLLNMILIAVLAWEHWIRIGEMEWERRKLHRVGLFLLLLAGAASVVCGATTESIHRGLANTTAELPVVAEHFAGLETSGRGDAQIRYEMLHNKLMHTVDAVITGEAPEAEVKAFAENHQLKSVEKPELYGRILPKAKRWKLQRKGFPTEFAPPDLAFVGRPKNGDKAVLQIAWRKHDSRFTAEFAGNVTDSGGAEGR